MADWTAELRFVLRGLKRSPTFVATIVGTLTLGLGLVSAIFAFADSYLFRQPQIPGIDRAYIVHAAGGLRQTDTDTLRHSALASLGFVEWSVGHRVRNFQLIVDGRRVDFYVEDVTQGFRKTLSIPLIAGRDFTDSDHAGDVVPVWLSYWFWMREFGGDRAVLGRTFTTGTGASAQHIVVVGILGPAVTSFNGANELPAAIAPAVAPVTVDPRRYSDPIVQLPKDMSIDVVAERIAAVLQGAATPPNRPRAITLEPLGEFQTAGGRPTAKVLLTGAILILLLAAVTIVQLLLARSLSRAHELATRTALGAGQWRVIRFLLTESFVLGIAGICGGLIIGMGLTRVIQSRIPMFPTAGRNLSLVPMVFDSRVIAITVALGLIVACAGALWPGWRVLRQPLVVGHRNERGSAAISTRLSRVILATELAVATTLMAGTTFIGSGIWRYLHQPLGFDYADRYWITVFKSDDQGLTAAERDFATQALLHAHGVRAASWDGWASVSQIEVPDHSLDPRSVGGQRVPANMFDAWHLRLRQGRWFSERESEGHEPVAVVDEKFAAIGWPGASPVGQEVRVDGILRHVVGVIEPRRASLVRATRPQVYVPADGTENFSRMLVWVPSASRADLEGIGARIRAAVAGSETTVRPVTLDWLFLRETGEAEFQWPVIATLGLLAFVVAGVGVFGLVSYLVAQRTSEYGIRIALGALPSDIWRHVTLHSVVPAVGGLVVGLSIARVLEVVVRSSVFGWNSSFQWTIIGVAAALVVATILAALVPARRAMRIDPATTLRLS